jgi:hypothetical protein
MACLRIGGRWEVSDAWRLSCPQDVYVLWQRKGEQHLSYPYHDVISFKVFLFITHYWNVFPFAMFARWGVGWNVALLEGQHGVKNRGVQVLGHEIWWAASRVTLTWKWTNSPQSAGRNRHGQDTTEWPAFVVVTTTGCRCQMNHCPHRGRRPEGWYFLLKLWLILG